MQIFSLCEHCFWWMCLMSVHVVFMLPLAKTFIALRQCFSTRVPWVATRGSAKTDRNCLGRNSQPQFYAVVAIQTLGSLHRVPWATQTFAEGSAAAKSLKNAALRHRCRSKQNFGGAKDFCPNFPKRVRKVVVQLLPTNFLPQRSWRSFSGVASQKRSSFVFLQTVWQHFWKSNNVGRLLSFN